MTEFHVFVDKDEKKVTRFPKWIELHRGHDATMHKVITVADQLIKVGKYRVTDFTLGTKQGPFKTANGNLLVGIERKGSIEELYSCVLGNDRPRFKRQLWKLTHCVKYPCLWLDFDPNDFSRSSRFFEKNPAAVLDAALAIADDVGVPLVFWPPPTRAENAAVIGEAMLRWMWSRVKKQLSR